MHGLGASSHLTSELAWAGLVWLSSALGGAGLGGGKEVAVASRRGFSGVYSLSFLSFFGSFTFSFGWSLGKGYHRVR